MKILVAEDEASVGRVLCKQLEALGYSAFGAASGDEAQRNLQEGLRPDLLITDLVMPGHLQGLDLAERSTALIPNLPIIFVTGYPNDATSDLLTSFESARFLWKPIRMADLAATVSELLSIAK